MAKVKVYIKLESEISKPLIKEEIGILKDNTLNFIIEEKKVTFILNDDNIIMDRRLEKTSHIEIVFKKNNSSAKIYYQNKVFLLNINVLNIIKEKNYFKIEYKLENQLYKLELKVGEIWS